MDMNHMSATNLGPVDHSRWIAGNGSLRDVRKLNCLCGTYIKEAAGDKLSLLLRMHPRCEPIARSRCLDVTSGFRLQVCAAVEHVVLPVSAKPQWQAIGSHVPGLWDWGTQGSQSLGERLPLSLLLDDISPYCADCTGQCQKRYETI